MQNWLSGQVVDDVDLVASVVPGTDAGNLSVTGPASVATGQQFELTFAWDVASLQPGEAWFGLVELGADRTSTANVGSILVTLRNPGSDRSRDRRGDPADRPSASRLGARSPANG